MQSRFFRVLVVIGLCLVSSVPTACAPPRESGGSSFERLVTFDGFDTRRVLMAEQERVAACMAREGFEYVAYVPRGADQSVFPVQTLAQIPDSVYAREHGYGFADSFEIQERAAAEDPNPAIVESMDPEERAAYFEALYGNAGAVEAPDGGCARSLDESYLNVVVARRDLIAEASERLFADPRYVDLEAEWSRCMARHGYELRDRLGGIVEHFEAQMDAIDAGGDPSALEALRRDEVEMAIADIACLEPIEDRLRELAAEHEERLFEEAAGLFDDMAAVRSRYEENDG